MTLLDAGVWGMTGAAAVEVMELYGAVKANKVFPWMAEDELPLGVYLFSIVWTPTGFVDTVRSGTMVYEERTVSGTGAQEVHPGI